jgi:hypothetical protein
VPCTPGFFSLYDASLCTECPVGKFQNEPGKNYCDEPKANALVKLVEDPKTGAVRAEPWACVTGMQCSGGSNRSYDGEVWHSPRIKYPEQKDMYLCVTDGCPDEGATNMTCKDGYDNESPLCALCSTGYQMQMRECAECKEPQLAALLLAAGGFAALAALAVWAVRKYSYLLTDQVMANVKLVISFATIASTVDTQFGGCVRPEVTCCLMLPKPYVLQFPLCESVFIFYVSVLRAVAA